jgi:hypothetical protein
MEGISKLVNLNLEEDKKLNKRKKRKIVALAINYILYIDLEGVLPEMLQVFR